MGTSITPSMRIVVFSNSQMLTRCFCGSAGNGDDVFRKEREELEWTHHRFGDLGCTHCRGSNEKGVGSFLCFFLKREEKDVFLFSSFFQRVERKKVMVGSLWLWVLEKIKKEL